jgi:5-formyltetrahydrofolate cyclo-ligase
MAMLARIARDAIQPTMENMQNKRELRPALLALRNALDPAQKRQSDRQIAISLLDWWESALTPSLGVYAPMRGEPELQQAYAALHARGVQLALPIVVTDNAPLKFVRWTPGEPLERDRFGAESPPATNPEVWPQALVIPCLGFNDGRFRLGYGGGFYDRTLAAVPRPYTVGVSYAFGEAAFAADTFDVALDRIITEEGTLID